MTDEHIIERQTSRVEVPILEEGQATYFGTVDPGFSLTHIPEKEIAPLKKNILSYMDQNFNGLVNYKPELAGHLEHEYRLTREDYDLVAYLMNPILMEYEKKSKFLAYKPPELSTSQPGQIVLESAWVNFQKKYEFNPLHKHRGVYSFVIWLQIPFKNEDEEECPHCGGASVPNTCGNFQFVTMTSLGDFQLTSLPIDNKHENYVALFPARMHHMVNPFYTSDDYRITIAGNYTVQFE